MKNWCWRGSNQAATRMESRFQETKFPTYRQKYRPSPPPVEKAATPPL
jgi:hypothetical protein